MQENSLKCIQGKKIRRQGFNIPLIILYSMMFAIPYTIFAISWCVGKLDTYGSPSTFWTSVLVCFLFSVPFLVLRSLNKHFFGKIICVLDEEGIYYANKGKLCWDSIEKIEYVIDSKPRYKSDLGKTWRVIIYTHGGKHVTLEKAPLYIISGIKKYQKSLDVKIIGANSLVTPILIMATILLICPFYVVLLRSAPEGVTIPHIIVMMIICVALGIVRMPIFDAYDIQYRFWSKLLPKKLLSHIVLGFYYSSYFIALIILFYFPNWVVVSLLGIYLGIVQPPIPSKNGSSRYRTIQSYKQLYEIYITQADFWEERIAKRKANKGK